MCSKIVLTLLSHLGPRPPHGLLGLHARFSRHVSIRRPNIPAQVTDRPYILSFSMPTIENACRLSLGDEVELVVSCRVPGRDTWEGCFDLRGRDETWILCWCPPAQSPFRCLLCQRRGLRKTAERSFDIEVVPDGAKLPSHFILCVKELFHSVRSVTELFGRAEFCSAEATQECPTRLCFTLLALHVLTRRPVLHAYAFLLGASHVLTVPCRYVLP